IDRDAVLGLHWRDRIRHRGGGEEQAAQCQQQRRKQGAGEKLSGHGTILVQVTETDLLSSVLILVGRLLTNINSFRGRLRDDQWIRGSVQHKEAAMANIVILGAGLGGMPMAYEMKDLAKPNDRVIVVSDKDYFHFVPSNPWVAVDWRKRDDIAVPLKKVLDKRGIELVVAKVTRVVPENSQLELEDGSTLNYDHLIIASGPR